MIDKGKNLEIEIIIRIIIILLLLMMMMNDEKTFVVKIK